MSRACEDAMAEDELVEQLASALYMAYKNTGANTKGMSHEGWKAVARECNRQMEWAGQAGIVYGLHGDTDPREYVITRERPALTLAPPDWKRRDQRSPEASK